MIAHCHTQIFVGVVTYIGAYHLSSAYILYSWKYWQELDLVVGSQIAILNVLADLNLAVWYGIAICIYAIRNSVDFSCVIWRLLEQTAKLQI